MRLCGRRLRRTKLYCYIVCILVFRRRIVVLLGMLLLFLTLLFMRLKIMSGGPRDIITGPYSKERFTVDSIRRFDSRVNASYDLFPGALDKSLFSTGTNTQADTQPPASSMGYFPKAKLHRRKPWPMRDWMSTAYAQDLTVDDSKKADDDNDGDDDGVTYGNNDINSVNTFQSGKDKAVDSSPKSGGDMKNIGRGGPDSAGVGIVEKPKERYLIYICDGKTNCYGFADRQRGIVSTYLLAELTNRTFGLIMTSPAPLEEYYVPNLVNWLLPKDVFKGKSSTELTMLGRRQQVDLGTTNFNKDFPEDIVYVRTNRDALHLRLELNPRYQHHYPKWAQGDWRQQFALGWLRLMIPSPLLRQEINNILIRIAKNMMQEYLIFQELQKLPCGNVRKFTDGHEAETDIKKSTALMFFDQCLNLIGEDFRKAPPDYSIRSNDIFDIIRSHPFRTSAEQVQSDEVSDMDQIRNLCLISSAIKPRHSPSEIQLAQHYDFIDLDLVCVHIRLGKNPSMPLEKGIRNTIQETDAVWSFLRPYVKSGRHVFLATDSEQVRQLGKSKFGRRVHVSEAPVVHIDKVKPSNVNLGNLGLQLALTEQLVLMTSCRTLVVSESGFSQRAAFIRRSLVDVDELFLFRDGTVVPWPLSY